MSRARQSAPRSALVTGATRGIGRGVANDLARCGYGLTVTARSAEELADLAENLRAAGAPRVVHRHADLASEGALPGVVEVHREAFGSMDALILNGGVGTAGPLDAVEQRRIDKTLAVNLTSALVLIRESLPMLRRAGADSATGARVVLLSSITGVFAEPGLAVYGASKAALVSLAETLNAEESRSGVLATAIAPGYVRTEMSDWVVDRVPAEEMIQVADIVAVVRMVLELGRTSAIPRIVVSRAGSSGYEA